MVCIEILDFVLFILYYDNIYMKDIAQMFCYFESKRQ